MHSALIFSVPSNFKDIFYEASLDVEVAMTWISSEIPQRHTGASAIGCGLAGTGGRERGCSRNRGVPQAPRAPRPTSDKISLHTSMGGGDF